MTAGPSPEQNRTPNQEIKRSVLVLAASVIVLDAAMIGAYYGFHISDRTMKTQQTYVGVWVVLTLLVVTTAMKRVRQARRRRWPAA